MDFGLSEEQRMFVEMFRDFSAREVAPGADEADHEEKLPPDLLRKVAEQGFFGATLPEKHRGAALDTLSYVLLVEALAAESVSLAVTLAAHVSMAATSVLVHGSDAQKETWLPGMATGEVIGAFALTEPDAGSDAASGDGRSLQTHAVVDGDEVILDGVKAWVTNGEAAGLFVVVARGANGVDAFLVPAGTPGLEVGYREPTLGLRSAVFNTVYLEGCRVPSTNRLGGSGEGGAIARQARDRMAISLAAAGLGVAAASIDAAARFAAERIQFGDPIARKQAIQTYVAGALIDVEALRYLVYRAAWLADRGGAFSVEASMVKAFGARVARGVTDRMVQVMGGYGYMEDYPLARRYRDARALGIVGGPTALHEVAVARNAFAARDVEVLP
jgi:alkylation response protein AidB-like acyl-CoA dehydrogenase